MSGGLLPEFSEPSSGGGGGGGGVDTTTVTTMLNGVAMSGDQTSSVLDKSGANQVAIQAISTQGAGAPDHVGVIKIKVSNANVVANAQVLDVPQIAVASGAEINEVVELDCYFPYMWIFYDRTSGGADDTLTVTVATTGIAAAS